MICTSDGSSWHQHIALPGDRRRLWLIVLRCIGPEGSSLRIEIHLRVGTQIHSPLQRRLQILYVYSELVLICPPCRLIQVLMKLPHLIFLYW